MRRCILGMDIGGTNTSIGIFDKKYRQVGIYANKTKEMHPYEALKNAINDSKKKGNSIIAAGFAVAGPVKNGRVHLTNAGLSLTLKQFKSILKMNNAVMLNDFEAVAYGLNALTSADAIALTKNKPKEKSVKVVLGAGTGLGKAILYYDGERKVHAPLSAEEGHCAIAISSEEEFDLMEFIKKRKKADVVWEDVLSGRGIATAYEFVIGNSPSNSSSEVKKEVAKSNDKARTISAYRKTDPACKKAFALFSIIYARFIRNSMLQSLSYGGVYVSGGIAIRNPDILKSKEFRNELYKKAVYRGIVKKIPLFVFSHTSMGLKGAAFAALNAHK
jgi:glucokinase